MMIGSPFAKASINAARIPPLKGFYWDTCNPNMIEDTRKDIACVAFGYYFDSNLAFEGPYPVLDFRRALGDNKFSDIVYKLTNIIFRPGLTLQNSRPTYSGTIGGIFLGDSTEKNDLSLQIPITDFYIYYQDINESPNSSNRFESLIGTQPNTGKQFEVKIGSIDNVKVVPTFKKSPINPDFGISSINDKDPNVFKRRQELSTQLQSALPEH